MFLWQLGYCCYNGSSVFTIIYTKNLYCILICLGYDSFYVLTLLLCALNYSNFKKLFFMLQLSTPKKLNYKMVHIMHFVIISNCGRKFMVLRIFRQMTSSIHPLYEYTMTSQRTALKSLLHLLGTPHASI